MKSTGKDPGDISDVFPCPAPRRDGFKSTHFGIDSDFTDDRLVVAKTVVSQHGSCFIQSALSGVGLIEDIAKQQELGVESFFRDGDGVIEDP